MSKHEDVGEVGEEMRDAGAVAETEAGESEGKEEATGWLLLLAGWLAG